MSTSSSNQKPGEVWRSLKIRSKSKITTNAKSNSNSTNTNTSSGTSESLERSETAVAIANEPPPNKKNEFVVTVTKRPLLHGESKSTYFRNRRESKLVQSKLNFSKMGKANSTHLSSIAKSPMKFKRASPLRTRSPAKQNIRYQQKKRPLIQLVMASPEAKPSSKHQVIPATTFHETTRSSKNKLKTPIKLVAAAAKSPCYSKQTVLASPSSPISFRKSNPIAVNQNKKTPIKLFTKNSPFKCKENLLSSPTSFHKTTATNSLNKFRTPIKLIADPMPLLDSTVLVPSSPEDYDGSASDTSPDIPLHNRIKKWMDNEKYLTQELSPAKIDLNLNSVFEPPCKFSSPSPRRQTQSQTFKSPAQAYYSPGEMTLNAVADFNKLPRDPSSPDFAYKPEKAIRKKAERAKLGGWECDMCRKYYEAIASQLTKEELQKIKDKCSRHRSKYPVQITSTPPNYWDPDFPTTQECIDRGYMGVGRRSTAGSDEDKTKSPSVGHSKKKACSKKLEITQDFCTQNDQTTLDPWNLAKERSESDAGMPVREMSTAEQIRCRKLELFQEHIELDQMEIDTCYPAETESDLTMSPILRLSSPLNTSDSLRSELKIERIGQSQSTKLVESDSDEEDIPKSPVLVRFSNTFRKSACSRKLNL